ncbi:NDR1/HIN1-like protein 10 [Lactuca sativa]|uniref:NDR1/HIN1-like protein 10 n=1 Tax=Lactuca sativa TaxID=4236 RepID=UPI000CC87F18|nr:NDR1/HIN1-like protein 10 [Lactuca sativa]
MADPPLFASGYRNSATIHPVSSPPNAPQNQPTNYSNLYAFKQRTIEHCSFGFLFRSIFCIGILILLIWQFWLISISLPKFHLETITLSNFHEASTAGDLHVHFILRNPNSKVTLHYDGIQAAVWYWHALLDRNSVPGFVQGPKNKTAIMTRFSCFHEFFFDGESKSDHVVINFDFRMMATYRSSAWGAKRKSFKVYCHGLQVDVSLKSHGGKMIGGWKNCMADGVFFSVNSPHFGIFNDHQ